MPYFLVVPNVKSGIYQPLCEVTCPSATKFLANLADKLETMTTSIKRQIEYIKQNCAGTTARGAILVEIDVPKMTIVVQQEYLIYIKRYGPPDNGIFNEDYLNIIRAEIY